jgi:hypothetical protein
MKESDMSIPPILHNDNLLFASFSHDLISLIWFVACDKLGIMLLESSISDCFEIYILNKFALSISSNNKLSLWHLVLI